MMQRRSKTCWFLAYGFYFPTLKKAREYKALVLSMEKGNLDPKAAFRLGSRFVDMNGGVSSFTVAA